MANKRARVTIQVRAQNFYSVVSASA